MKLFKLLQTSFDNFDNTINQYLNKAFDSLGIQYSNNQIFKVILNAISSIFQNTITYIEDAFTEQNIETAIRKKSIISLAKLSGYEAYYGSAATGTLIGTLISNTNLSSEIKKIYVDNYSNIINAQTGMNYVLYLQSNRYVFDITNPLIGYEFRIVQGYHKRDTHISQGNKLENINVYVNGLFDKNYIKVYVNNIEWQPVSNLYDMTENGEEYIISVGFNNELDITFGNGVYGKIPNEGDTITIDYIVHNGDQGNVDSLSNNSFMFSSLGYDYNGGTIDLNNYIKLSINNYISGGTNSDTIADIRRMIGYNSRSNVLASVENYILFLKHFSFIGNFNVWIDPNTNTLMINAITNKINTLKDVNEYEDIHDADLILSDEQKSNITTVLKNSNNTVAGISIGFVDPIIYKYAIICYVKISDSYYKDSIIAAIQTSVLEYFSKLNYNISFISKSDILNYILNNVDNIKSLDLDIISEANEEAFANKYYFKYEAKYINNKVIYKKIRYNYESNLNLGLDDLGNISIDNNLYIPILHGNIKYYPDKKSSALNSMNLNAVNVVFI